MSLVNTFLVACVLAVSTCASPPAAAAPRGDPALKPQRVGPHAISFACACAEPRAGTKSPTKLEQFR
jgi:hypothetical protein